MQDLVNKEDTFISVEYKLKASNVSKAVAVSIWLLKHNLVGRVVDNMSLPIQPDLPNCDGLNTQKITPLNSLRDLLLNQIFVRKKNT